MQDAFGEVRGAQQGQGVDFPGAFEMRHALLVAFAAAFELSRPAPLLLQGCGRLEGHRRRTPQPCQHDADAGIKPDQAERNHPLVIAGERGDPDLLAIRLQRADKAIGMKGPYWQGSVKQRVLC